jgi:hypothetical protein
MLAQNALNGLKGDAAAGLTKRPAVPLNGAANGTPPAGVNVPPSVGTVQGIRGGPANPSLNVPTGKPADANPWQVSANPPSAPSVAPLNPTPVAPVAPITPPVNPAANVPGASVAPIDPTNDLRSTSVLPDQGVDRYQLAQDRFKTFSDSTDPEYQASLREANTAAAGAGQLGSGMLRTRLGDLALSRTRDLDTNKQHFLQDALEGSIGDARSNRDEVRGERGYQVGQEQNSHDRQVQQLELDDFLKNSAAGRGKTLLDSGYSGNPSDAYAYLSSLFGKSASDAGSAAAGLVGASRQNQNAGTGLDWLQQLLKGGGGADADPSQVPYDINDPNQNIFAGTH